MEPTPYHILRKEGETDFVWIAAVRDMRAAKTCVQELSVRSTGQYLVFDERSQKVLAQLELFMGADKNRIEVVKLEKF